MYEYLRALKERFSPEVKKGPLIREIEASRQTLARRLDKQGRKELLRLLDAQDALRYETALNSFVAGFRLAKGIEAELGVVEPYSYAKEQERQACKQFRKGCGI